MRDFNLEKRLENLKISNEESKRITRESIQTALINMMATNSFEEISITDLVKKSGVSRADFYRNYKNKEDVLKDFASNILGIVVTTLKDEYLKENLYEWFRMFYTKLKESRKVVSLILKAKINVYEYMIESGQIMLRDYSIEEEYQLSALIAGMIALSVKWYRNDFRESVNEMADITYELYKHLKPIF